jgi:glucosamine-6-phosphate deaminase
MKLFTVEKLKVRVFESRRLMGAAAASDVAAKMKDLLVRKDRVRMIFAAAPSQNEFIDTLAHADAIDWSRVTAFQMDEYIGLAPGTPQSLQRYLQDRLFKRVKPGELQLMDPMAPPEAECERYTKLVKAAPIDIVCLGIGDNGHLAFNEPHVADFEDKATVRIVEPDSVSRRQQVNSKIFGKIDEVPSQALTLTVPALTSGAHLFCIVPGTNKREAVRHTLQSPVSTDCPATILRRHPDCTLYLELDSHGK